MSHQLTNERHNADEWVQYRSLSTLAVLALLLGLCSALAFLGPLGLAIPLVAVAVAFLALARINAAGDSLTGRSLALSGFALAVVFAAGALTHVYVRDSLSIRQADEAAHRWLMFVSAGKAEEAMEVMTPDALMRLQPSSPTQDGPPPPFDPAKAIELLQNNSLVQALAPGQPGASVKFQTVDQQFFWVERDPQVGSMFKATGAQAEQVEGTVVLTRKLNAQGEVAWLVSTWNLTNPQPKDEEAEHQH